MPSGIKRDRLMQWLTVDLRLTFDGRLLAVDDRVAEKAGELAARARQSGTEAERGDSLIAATALVHGLKVATLNRKHFERLGVGLVDF